VSVFVDTSAFYALMVRSETAHEPVRKAFARVLDSGRPMWTTSFVLVETMALLQHRIGLDAARDFDEELLPAIRVTWVDEDLYRAGADRLWREDRRDVSLVDCVSFEFMKREGLTTALAVDADFSEAGFDVIPVPR
jgi:predicted nucleic acid-binding protein